APAAPAASARAVGGRLARRSIGGRAIGLTGRRGVGLARVACIGGRRGRSAAPSGRASSFVAFSVGRGATLAAASAGVGTGLVTGRGASSEENNQNPARSAN